MNNKVFEYLKSIMPEEYKEEYLQSFEVDNVYIKPAIDKDRELFGYSYTLFSRVLLQVEIHKKQFNRLHIFNYQDIEKDLKKDIEAIFPKDLVKQYELKEKDSIRSSYRRLIKIKIDNKNDEELFNAIASLKDVLIEKMFDIYLNYSTVMTFGCCGLYVECSNAMRCLMHDRDPLYARGCQYRENLEKGLIFYGDNKGNHSKKNANKKKTEIEKTEETINHKNTNNDYKQKEKREDISLFDFVDTN